MKEIRKEEVTKKGIRKEAELRRMDEILRRMKEAERWEKEEERKINDY